MLGDHAGLIALSCPPGRRSVKPEMKPVTSILSRHISSDSNPEFHGVYLSSLQGVHIAANSNYL